MDMMKPGHWDIGKRGELGISLGIWGFLSASYPRAYP
jgi:hypothetical protein